MIALAGPLHIVALVLVISGVQKVVSPRPAVDAMRAAGLPRLGTTAVPGIVLGTVEAATGVAGLAVPSRLVAAWIAVFYAALAAFVVVLRRRDATAGCGCFGATSAPPGRAHLAANLASAAVAATAAVVGVPDIVDAVPDVGVAVPYIVLLTTGAGLVLLGPSLLATIDQRTSGSMPRRFGLR